MVEVLGDYVRITGLRLRGEDRATSPSTYPSAFATAAIGVGWPGPTTGPLFSVATMTQFIATIDHNDISDWGEAAVLVYGPYDLDQSNNLCSITYMGAKYSQTCRNFIPNPSQGNFLTVAEDPATLANVRVARNFIHHNQKDEGGYGVAAGRAFVEGNVFVSNRHAITAGGEPHDEYRASYNLVLSNSPRYGSFPHTYVNQDFDMHGTNGGYGGVGGFHVDILGNTFFGISHGTLSSDHANYWLRGDPSLYTDFHNNVSLQTQDNAVVFHPCSPGSICGNSSFPINIFNNHFSSPDPTVSLGPVSLGVGDFDGDGDEDLFLATGEAWYHSPAGAREWRFLSAKSDTIDQLLFGDFDGDGRTDVVAIHGGQLVVSWGGISDWEVLNSNSLLSCSITDMHVGKFLDHPPSDRRDDIFCADGLTWYVSYGGTGPFNFALDQANSFRVSQLRFGDFNGDGKTDVFGVGNNGWQISYSQSGFPTLSNWNPLPVSLTNTVNGLYVADFSGTGLAAIATECDPKYYPTGDWCMWQQGSPTWQNFSLGLPPSVAGIGKFRGLAQADLLLWDNGGVQFSISVGGNSSVGPWSTQDMR
jgi:hypothetical protein